MAGVHRWRKHRMSEGCQCVFWFNGRHSVLPQELPGVEARGSFTWAGTKWSTSCLGLVVGGQATQDARPRTDMFTAAADTSTYVCLCPRQLSWHAPNVSFSFFSVILFLLTARFVEVHNRNALISILSNLFLKVELGVISNIWFSDYVSCVHGMRDKRHCSALKKDKEIVHDGSKFS